MADAAKLSERHVLKIGSEKAIPSDKALAKLHAAAKILDNASASEQALRQRIKALMEERQVSIRSLAGELEIDLLNLAKVLSGSRSTGEHLVRVHKYLTKGI